jgi:hypothetical protein
VVHYPWFKKSFEGNEWAYIGNMETGKYKRIGIGTQYSANLVSWLEQDFSELRTNSTVTQWKELAEAFSHQPTNLWYDHSTIGHNGTEKGYLYIIDEPVTVGVDIYQHPRTTMDENAEFLTKRPLKVKMICELSISIC